MTLREQIAGTLVQYSGFDRFAEEQDRHMCTRPTLDDATDRILEIVRTALLSKQAVEAGAIAQWDYNKVGDEWPEWSNLDLGVKKIYREFTVATANAMFAAAGLTGGQGDGTPYATLQSRTGDDPQETQGEHHGRQVQG